MEFRLEGFQQAVPAADSLSLDAALRLLLLLLLWL